MTTRFTTITLAALVAIGCSSIKNTPGSQPPPNSICDQIDFGLGPVWVCAASQAALDAQKNLAGIMRSNCAGIAAQAEKADAGK